MFTRWMIHALVTLALTLAAVNCDESRGGNGFGNVQLEQRSLSERIAFACAHKPSLSFCVSTTVPTTTTTTAPAVEGSSLPSETRRNDSPTPRHRRVRWVFVPHSGPGDSRFWDDLAKSAQSPSREREEPKKVRETTDLPLIIPPEPFEIKKETSPTRALQSRTFPVLPSDAAYGAGQVHAADGNPFSAFNSLTDEKGLAHRPRSRSPFTKPGLWEPNPDDPHSRDPANKWWYKPESVGVDWLNGQASSPFFLQWGGHWAVPAAGVGGTNGQSTLHFPSIGTFLGIPDDYD